MNSCQKRDYAMLDSLYDKLEGLRPTNRSVYPYLIYFAHRGIIQRRFVSVSADIYVNFPQDASFANDVFLFLTCVYDSSLRYELMDCHFVRDCLPRYFSASRTNLSAHMANPFSDPEQLSNAPWNRIFEFIELYMNLTPFSSVTEPVYIDIYTLLINLAYIDIINESSVHNSMDLYAAHSVPTVLHYEIVNFLHNVYFDSLCQKFLNKPAFVNTVLVPFILNYGDTYPAYIAGMFKDYGHLIVDKVSPDVIDVLTNVLCAHAAFHEEIITSLVPAMKILNKPWMYDMIVSSPCVLHMVSTTIQSADESRITKLVDLFSTMTASIETERPCEFMYRHMLVPLCQRPSTVMNETLTYRIVFSMTNVLAAEPNWHFVDIALVINFLCDVMKLHPARTNTVEHVFYCIKNMSFCKEFMKALVHTPQFMTSFTYWIVRLSQKWISATCRKYVHQIIIYVLTAAARFDAAHHFNSLLGDVVCELAQGSPTLRTVVNNAMHCTLQQKAGLVLYRQKKITRRELRSLDVNIYTLGQATSKKT